MRNGVNHPCARMIVRRLTESKRLALGLASFAFKVCASAMEAGVSKKLWNIQDIVYLIDWPIDAKRNAATKMYHPHR